MCHRQDDQIKRRVEQQRDGCNQTRQTIEQDHEEHNQQDADCARLDAGGQRLFTQLRADRAHADLFQRERQLTDVDLLCQCLRSLCREAARNDTGIAGDAGRRIFRADRRLRQNLIVHHNLDGVLAILCVCRSLSGLGPRFDRVFLKCNLDIMLAGKVRLRELTIAGFRGLDAGTIENGIAVRIDELQLCRRTERGNGFRRIIDRRNVHLDASVADQLNRCFGVAQRIQTLLHHGLYGSHVGFQIRSIVAVLQNSLKGNGRTADQVKATPDAVFLIQCTGD